MPDAPKLLTIRRMTNGSLMPYVDGEPIHGCINIVTNSGPENGVIQLAFDTTFVMFETERNPITEKLS